jgi:hypothetical protein
VERTAVGPELSRRQLFAGAAAVALPAYVGDNWARSLATPPARPGGGHASLTFAAFTAAVGTRFRARTASFQFVDLTLVEANAHPERPGPVRLTGESYSLIFAGHGYDLAAATYRVGHPHFGWFPLSLAPVGMGRNGRRYEAVVNRRMPASR